MGDQPARRYVIVHGHFYQPPRESPWTGLIANEPGAAPFPNWNERILSECYTANAHAHVMSGHVVRIRNNYESIQYDFGPTLLSWMQRHGRTAYRALSLADKASGERRGGHGNAMAQSYHHSILPLLAERDKELQIGWGIEDFAFRFGRKPEGIWLPECAADDDTLAAAASAGIQFVLLAPQQGEFKGSNRNGDGAGPFIWNRGDLKLAVFRFDRELSADVSFGDALENGERLAERIINRALALNPESALLLATDGETFGHHKKTGAATLAKALSILEERDDIAITNCAEYLATHYPAGTFEISAPSSWSCPHGVERWRSDCGCRLDQSTNQAWRRPLREAMEFVKNHADTIYDRFAAPIVEDPFGALKASMRLAIDPNPAIHEEFYRRFKVADEVKRERLTSLFEMERAAHAALVSCAWFFDDFGGPEGKVVLRWAARAVEVAALLAPSVEPELLMRLRGIHSNRRDIGDAATLYLSLKTREMRGRV
jgi:alpha-amylase/alpha-mannosidase (GH57 family)